MSPKHTEVIDCRPGPDDPGCRATREILDRIGDKWSLYIIATLEHGPLRFSELKRLIEGISQRMLTLTLRGLERDGLVTRTVYPSVPPRVDYELTQMGLTLLEPVMALVHWTIAHKEAIVAAHERFDAAPAPEQGPVKGVIYRQR